MKKILAFFYGLYSYRQARKLVDGYIGPSQKENWERLNFHNRKVCLGGGVKLAGALALSQIGFDLQNQSRGAGVLAVLGSGIFGFVDDTGEKDQPLMLFDSARPPLKAKGFKGHLGNLKNGYITTGALKIFGISLVSLVASALLHTQHQKSKTGVFRDALLLASSANLANLFDLRPGRVLKVGLMTTLPLVRCNPFQSIATIAALFKALPADLAEKEMLGDTGANALGASLGISAIRSLSPRIKNLSLLAVLGLTLASEKVSFTKVIAQTPGLREIDNWGRRK